MILTCPNCNEKFEVDQSHYASLLEQVRNQAFEEEIERRVKQLEATQKAEAEAAQLKNDAEIARIVAEKDEAASVLKNEIATLKGQVAGFEAEKKALQSEADKAISEATSKAETDKLQEISRIKESSASEISKIKESKEREISELREKKDKAISDLKEKKDSEINRLTLELSQKDAQRQLDIQKVENKGREQLMDKEQTIRDLSSQLASKKLEADNAMLQVKEQHAEVVRLKDEEIGRLRDMKSRLSTKMIGETLEQHCENTFRIAQSRGSFPTATFEKDNDASGGTKGDFIFRDFIDKQECLSIMFEMKNEADTTATKHRNEDFFKKLNDDRNKKNCEYAVLVTMLEADNELYNEGIVDVSYRYPKMYVVRPQFFLPVIALLSQSSRKNAAEITQIRKELAEAKAQSVDVTNFEERRNKFAAAFAKHFEKHQKKHNEALDEIDKAIAAAEKQIEKLRQIKALFTTSTSEFGKANDAVQNDFTIKKLVHGNRTMRAKFDEARKARELEAPASDEPHNDDDDEL